MTFKNYRLCLLSLVAFYFSIPFLLFAACFFGKPNSPPTLGMILMASAFTLILGSYSLSRYFLGKSCGHCRKDLAKDEKTHQLYWNKSLPIVCDPCFKELKGG